jgi:hypothetical protein
MAMNENMKAAGVGLGMLIVGAGGGNYLGWQPQELADTRVELARCEARLEAKVEAIEAMSNSVQDLIAACEQP